MNPTHPDLKQKAKHELKNMLELFLYLAFFFIALSAYKMLLLNEYHVKYWDVTFALVNALVITKVIAIGEYAKLGRRHEGKALLISAAWKAVVFGLLVFAFHVVEEVIRRLVHGAETAATSREIRFDELAARSLIILCIFIPLFAFRELRRAMGEEEFNKLVYGLGGRGK